VVAVYRAASEAAEWCRAGKGPYFLECLTYRWREHVGPLWDYDAGYRTKAEVDAWMARCPMKRLSEQLVSTDVCKQDEIQRWYKGIQQEVDEAVAVAKSSAFPSEERLMEGIY